jgi:hypothetical protein
MVGEGEDNQVKSRVHGWPWLMVDAADAPATRGTSSRPSLGRLATGSPPHGTAAFGSRHASCRNHSWSRALLQYSYSVHLWHIAAPRISLGHSLPILQVIIVPRRALALQYLLYKRQNVRIPAHITMPTRRYTHAQLLTHTQPVVHNLGRRKRDLSSAFGIGELIIGVLREDDCAWSDGCDNSMRVIG